MRINKEEVVVIKFLKEIKLELSEIFNAKCFAALIAVSIFLIAMIGSSMLATSLFIDWACV